MDRQDPEVGGMDPAGDGLVDSAPEGSFDRIARLAARKMGTAVCLISLLDDRRLWFRGRWGLDIANLPVDLSICRHAMARPQILEVPDARADPRFCANPMVIGPPYIRFYAGLGLVTASGEAVGVLCVADTAPRAALTDEQRDTLRDLAGLAMDRLELFRQLHANAALLRQTKIAERLTGLAAEASSFAVAIQSACEFLLGAAGAQACLVLRMNEAGTQLRFVHAVSAGSVDPVAFAARWRQVRFDPQHALAARAMRSGEQFAGRVSDEPLHNLEANRAALEDGNVATLHTPFSLFDQHYVFSLGFAEAGPAWRAAAPLMRGAVTALRPLLRRLLDEERLALFQRAVEASTDPVLITEAEPLDAPGPVTVYANRATEQVTGYTLAEVIGQTPRMFQGTDTDPATRSAIRTALGQWQPIRTTILNYHKDGTPIWIQLNIAPVFDDEGWCTHWVSVQRDLTQERALLAEVEAARHDLAALIDAMPGVLMRYRHQSGDEWSRIFVAPSVIDLTGYTPGEAMVCGWGTDNTDPQDLPLVKQGLQMALAGGQTTATFRFRRKDGAWLWVRMILRRHVGRSGVHDVLGIWSDVTRERELAERLAQSSKLAQLGEMATGMAHELNQPLAAISLAAENAQRELARLTMSAPRLSRRLDVILEMADRASGLIDHMRVFGRTGGGPSAPVEIPAAVAKAMSLIAVKLRDSRVRVRLDLPKSLPPVLAKTVPLEQVLINLFSNACDAYLERAEAEGARDIVVAGEVAEGMVQITVADRAGGIAEAVMGQIFQPFLTTKPVGSGTGLGLSISYGIIAELGGSIEVCNRDGGAWFVIRLPEAK